MEKICGFHLFAYCVFPPYESGPLLPKISSRRRELFLFRGASREKHEIEVFVPSGEEQQPGPTLCARRGDERVTALTKTRWRFSSRKRRRSGGSGREGRGRSAGSGAGRAGSRAGTAGAARRRWRPRSERFFSISRQLAHQCSWLGGKKKRRRWYADELCVHKDCIIVTRD